MTFSQTWGNASGATEFSMNSAETRYIIGIVSAGSGMLIKVMPYRKFTLHGVKFGSTDEALVRVVVSWSAGAYTH